MTMTPASETVISRRSLSRVDLRALASSSLSWLYLALVYAFIFLPVAVLVLFSFQDGRLPVPPFPGGPLMRWPILVAGMSYFALRDRL